MAKATKPIPDGYGTVTPYLNIRGAADAIAFYAKAFGAKELFRMPQPDGRIGHAELQIGTSRVMLADEFPEREIRGPVSLGGSSVGFSMYVEDVDAVVARAVAAGATIERPVEDQFYGDRVGIVKDPFGHVWYVATHKEDLSPEEMKQRAAAQKPL
jgi:PhnB protein